MKILIKKTIIVLITIITMSNFIMPNSVFALGADPGKQIVAGFFYLLSYVGDTAINIMQKVMLGDGDIEEGGEYYIKYSPGIIFSDEVAGLKINFIAAEEKTGTTTYLGTDADSTNEFLDILKRLGDAKTSKKMEMDLNTLMSSGSSVQMSYIGQHKNSSSTSYFFLTSPKLGSFFMKKTGVFGFDMNGKYDDDGKHKNFTDTLNPDTGFLYMWIFNDKLYVLESKDDIRHSDADDIVDGYTYYKGINDLSKHLDKLSGNIASNGGWYANGYHKRQDIVEIIDSATLYSYDLLTINKDAVYKESIAYELQSNIATWYKALRRIALVGLLSVLVYVGIRIILSSSSAQDKAKYKNMLKDWLVAICILFMLHYAMAFMLGMTENINDIIKSNVIKQNADGNNYDELMSTIRSEFEISSKNKPSYNSAGYAVMYLALVILTGVFTFQYLKRVIFMAFLTMIAPMIALTYPLDKIKDGKAQAFSYWLREYIFNCLIQPVHLLLYTIFVTNAIDFAIDNMLYAIVALGFLVPAEKFVKEMFGMKTQSPTGQLGAAAGGAMVMSMLNKIKGNPLKEGTEGGNSANANGVRTATRNAGGGTTGGSSSGGTGGLGSGGTGGSGSGGTGGTGGSGSGGTGGTGGSSGSGASSGSTYSPGRGLRNLGKGLAIKGVDGIKSAGIGMLKNSTKLPGAALGATIGLAATVASGGENGLTFLGGGAAAGAALSSNALGNLVKAGKDGYKDYQQGKLGIEAYNNRQFDKQFFKGDGYKMIAEDPSIQSMGINVKEATQQFLDNGITDAGKIREALQNGITGDTYKAYEKAEGLAIKDIPTLANAGIGAAEYNMLKGAGVKDASKMEEIVRNHKGDVKAVARNAGLASQAKALGITSKNKFVQYVKSYGGLGDTDAEKLYNQMKDFWS